MAELKTSVDKALMSSVAECFLKHVQSSACMTPSCGGMTGMLNDSASGDLHPEGLYPFSVADPIKLDGSGWMENDYVKGDSCEDIYKLLDDTVPVTDPETEVYAADGTSLTGRWIHTARAGGWRSDHPTYPYWHTQIPHKIDVGYIDKIVIYDTGVVVKNIFNTMFNQNTALPDVVLTNEVSLNTVTTSIVHGNNLVIIFRLGLTESVTYTDITSLYAPMAEAITEINNAGCTVVMNPPANAPTHLVEVYKQISEDFGLVYLPSSVPMDANTSTLIGGDPIYTDIRIAYWLMNEVLSSSTAEGLLMFSPNPTTHSVGEIVKHLDVEMRTP